MRVFRSTNQDPMKKIKDKGRSFSKRNAGTGKEAGYDVPIFVPHTPGGGAGKENENERKQSG